MAARTLRFVPRVAEQHGLRGLRRAVWPATSTLPHLRNQPARAIDPLQGMPARAAAIGHHCGGRGLRLSVGAHGA